MSPIRSHFSLSVIVYVVRHVSHDYLILQIIVYDDMDQDVWYCSPRVYPWREPILAAIGNNFPGNVKFDIIGIK